MNPKKKEPVQADYSVSFTEYIGVPAGGDADSCRNREDSVVNIRAFSADEAVDIAKEVLKQRTSWLTVIHTVSEQTEGAFTARGLLATTGAPGGPGGWAYGEYQQTNSQANMTALQRRMWINMVNNS